MYNLHEIRENRESFRNSPTTTYLYFITETTVPMQVKVTAETFHHEQFLHVHLDFPHHSIFRVLVHLLSRVTNLLVILV